MKVLKLSLLILVTLLTTTKTDAAEINVIPKPKTVKVESGSSFTINAETKIRYNDSDLKELAELLSSIIYSPTALKLTTAETEKATKNSISLQIDPSIENSEGYILNVTNKGIEMKGGSNGALFYAIQTLLQLMPAQIESDKLQNFDLEVPAVYIADQPQFKWRGVMFDVARYFFSKEYVLRFIDMMSMYKLNTLHLHLVDDSGWRIEIKKYPKLTSVGAFHGEGEKRTGGYYTQEELKEMVEYGALRGVEIVPELEFPAHMLSAVVPYPWLSCREEQLEMPDQHYISKDLLCVGKESSIEFLRDVIKETCEIFPSKYIHIGGDEAVYTYWEQCPHCQKVMKEQGLSKASELQSYLTNIVAGIAAEHGRTLVGWDEILERGEVKEKVVSMIWRDMKAVKNVEELGHKAILTPADFIYFDFPESRLPGEMKAATWKGPISVEKCYNFSTAEFEGGDTAIGVQASMWSDQFIHGTILQELSLLNENRSENYIEYMMLPRMLALAEVAWTPTSLRNFNDFENRLNNHYERLTYAGFNYRIPVPTVKSTKVSDGYMVELSSPLKGATIYYTNDGKKPTTYDNIYTQPVKVSQLSDVRAIAALSKTHHSVATYHQEDYSKYNKYGKYVSTISHNKLNGTTKLSVDLTGKISADGNYEITIVPLTDGVNIDVQNANIFKRDEIAASTEFGSTITTMPTTKPFAISAWQAGTPYRAEFDINVSDKNSGNIAIFILKK